MGVRLLVINFFLHVTSKCTVVALAELGSMFELESDLGRSGHPSYDPSYVLWVMVQPS